MLLFEIKIVILFINRCEFHEPESLKNQRVRILKFILVQTCDVVFREGNFKSLQIPRTDKIKPVSTTPRMFKGFF